jgi:hypothetical protein
MPIAIVEMERMRFVTNSAASEHETAATAINAFAGCFTVDATLPLITTDFASDDCGGCRRLEQ